MKTKRIADELEKCLTDLENRLDPAVEDELLDQWRAFTEGRFRGDVFRPVRKTRMPASLAWPVIRINHAQENEDAMLLAQYRTCSNALEAEVGTVLCVRSSYGTGILSSLFGADLFVMDEEMNTLPTTRPLADLDAIRAVLDRGIPDWNSGLGRKVFNTGRRFAEVARRFPRIGKYVHIYHPDLQGPMDVVELLWGSRLFLDVMDEPDLVHAVLRLVTDTYTGFMKEWEKIVPPRAGYAVHWGAMHAGRIMLRDDSAMNFSPEMYREFIQPYDAQLLRTLGGGAVHFCGRGDHYIADCCSMEGMHAIAMSQPQCNDMETIFRNTVDKGIKLINLSPAAVDAALQRKRALHGCVQTR